MSETELELDMDELGSAEEFLEYFKVAFDPAVVHVNRLHILQRFHDYMAEIQEMPGDEAELYDLYHGLLQGAYEDFVKSDAMTEKVFKVFHMHETQETFVPLSSLK